MSQKKAKKKIQWKAILISFGITCVMLGVVIGAFLWYSSYLSRNGNVVWEGGMTELIIGNGIAFLVMFGILYHFIKKPKEDQQEKW